MMKLSIIRHIHYRAQSSACFFGTMQQIPSRREEKKALIPDDSANCTSCDSLGRNKISLAAPRMGKQKGSEDEFTGKLQLAWTIVAGGGSKVAVATVFIDGRVLNLVEGVEGIKHELEALRIV